MVGPLGKSILDVYAAEYFILADTENPVAGYRRHSHKSVMTINYCIFANVDSDRASSST